MWLSFDVKGEAEFNALLESNPVTGKIFHDGVEKHEWSMNQGEEVPTDDDGVSLQWTLNVLLLDPRDEPYIFDITITVTEIS